MNSINGFFGEYRFLSNYTLAEVIYEGDVYPSTEHAYQAAKSLDRKERIPLMKADCTCKWAKHLGYGMILQKNWDQIKYEIMFELVRQKFTNHLDLKTKLLATGSAYLEETNTWNDKYWGVCHGIGQNNLGKILMKVRSGLG